MAAPQQQSQGMLDVLIRAGLIAVLAVFCYRVFRPFLDLMLWSLILAVTLYPLHCRLRGHLGRSDARTATLLVLIVLGLLLVPVFMFADSLATSAQNSIAALRSGAWRVPPPVESVASWPLIGNTLYGLWEQAATNLTGVLQKLAPHLKDVSLNLLGGLASMGASLLIFVAAVIIAGIIMAYGETGGRSAVRIATRLVGPERGAKLAELCTATIRAVAQGVVGIAFIQMLLIGIGFIVMGIPGAGLLALAVLLLGIMQLPVTLITLPVIGVVFATQGATAATITFAIYSLIAGLSDNVLKPLLLGRGVDVPMPVVLIGALGGMVVSGIIGLFIGPVLLAVGYNLFWQWVDDQPQPPANRPHDA
jgi:predicted PurR-regulated permease PerM